MHFLKTITPLINGYNETFHIPALITWMPGRYSQKAAIRVNALSAIDGAFGGGISYAIGKRSTVELAGSLRPWKRSEEYVNRYWLLQPEYKYWTCQKYNGFFWGGYLNGAQFNIGGKKLPFGIFSQLNATGTKAGWQAEVSAADITGC